MLLIESKQFLSNLLNRQIEADLVLRLSSAQRARFHAWLHARNVSIQDSILKSDFTLIQLGLGAESTTDKILTKQNSEFHLKKNIIMPESIGIDIQSISEFISSINLNDFKSDESLIAIFTPKELSFAQTSNNPAETLCGLWSGKEAIRKALGGPEVKLEKIRSFEILPDEYGAPFNTDFNVSISHSGGFSIAVAVAKRMQIEANLSCCVKQAVISEGRPRGELLVKNLKYEFIRIIGYAVSTIVLGAIIYWRYGN